MTFLAEKRILGGKVRYASFLETAIAIKILQKNGRVRYGTLRYGMVDKLGAPTILSIFEETL